MCKRGKWFCTVDRTAVLLNNMKWSIFPNASSAIADFPAGPSRECRLCSLRGVQVLHFDEPMYLPTRTRNSVYAAQGNQIPGILHWSQILLNPPCWLEDDLYHLQSGQSCLWCKAKRPSLSSLTSLSDPASQFYSILLSTLPPWYYCHLAVEWP